MTTLLALAFWTLLISLITAALYAWDKRAALTGGRRIPEKTLLLCAAAGGWPGGWAAGQRLRHKTRKLSYRAKFAGCVGLHLTACGAALWWWLAA